MAKDRAVDEAAGACMALPAAESHEEGPRRRPASEKEI